ncbi:hypothetical protein [Lacticaseibacillus suibinensis]|uniref:hypothetical protein n=1 Tax=Lacticaseibacillus suibinensis TaxID=2486011 RepID=UPI0019445B79|nr:hypothetical protein [Lacticaseibacillus suibinensis]
MLNFIIERFHLPINLDHRRDRIALYAALSVPISLLMAATKLLLGVVFLSSWLLIFGAYYTVLLTVKVLALWRYHRIRVSDSPVTAKIQAEQAFLTLGGLGFGLIGVTFGIFCYVMYRHGYNQQFDLNAALVIAMIGFTKLTAAIIGLVRSRHLLSPLITLLKAYSVVVILVGLWITLFAAHRDLTQEENKESSCNKY